MARRKPPEVSVDIFNFLGVIKNVLGVLMVIIIGLALGAAESGSDGGGGFSSEEMAALAKEAQEQTKKEEAKEKPEATTGPSAGDTGKGGSYMAPHELEKLVEMIAQASIVQGLVATGRSHPKPDKDLAEFEKEYKDLFEEYNSLKQQIKNNPAAQVAAKTVIQLAAGGSGTRPFNACFIECDSRSLLIHPPASMRDEKPSAAMKLRLVVESQKKRILKSQIEATPEFREYIDKLRNEYHVEGIVFMVRPNGVPTYRAAERVAKSQVMRYEALAVPGYGPIDLGVFGQPKK